mgnify:CR=1 FL=1
MTLSEIFENNSDFSEWLDSNYWFQDGYLLDYKLDKSKNVISLNLAYQVDGTYEANTERTLKVFSVSAEGVRKHTEIEKGEWSTDHCMEGLDVKDSDFVLFTLDIPKSIEIECSRVIVQEEPNKIEMVQPWLSETELFISVKGYTLPTPKEWLSWFKETGHILGWRYYSGELKCADSVPQKSYDGWYLQEISSIPKTSQGLFFRHCKQEGDKFDISLQRTELCDNVWNSLKIIFLRFQDVEISSGNCKFNREQWLEKINER